MATSNPGPDADVSSPVQHDTEAFDRALHQLLDGDEEPSTTRILFHGGTREEIGRAHV